jgi:very-short-patch-repair endonuclease
LKGGRGMMSNNNYNKKLKPIARQLRKNSTKSEANLWLKVLKARKLKGYQFLRQRPIGNYIVDFFCKELKLIIELDGITHTEKEIYDSIREKYLKNLGFNFIRISDNEVINNINGVFSFLENWIDEYESKHPEIFKIKVRHYKSPPSIPTSSEALRLQKGEV